MTASSEFSLRLLHLLQILPPGRVISYGRLAAAAGSPRGARQVVRFLHSSAERLNLPWHRVVDRHGTIRLPHNGGWELQKALLEAEGVEVDGSGVIDLGRYLWIPSGLQRFTDLAEEGLGGPKSHFTDPMP